MYRWQDLSLAPATFVRSLARKLGADTEDPPDRANKKVPLTTHYEFTIYIQKILWDYYNNVFDNQPN